MLLVDLTHTSHTRARTGVQRVCRALHRAIEQAVPTTPIVFDRFARSWRGLTIAERASLRGGPAAGGRGARWSWRDRLRGRWMRLTGTVTPPLPSGADGLIVPEIFSPDIARNFPPLAARVRGPCVAVFHDAIALKLPEMTPPRTVGRFPGYLQELLTFDGIAAVSDDSRSSLLDYWRWLDVNDPPPVLTLPLGLDPAVPGPDEPLAPGGRPVVLCVSTVEGRKNHLELLAAAEALWTEGVDFELWLVGLTQPVTGLPAARQIDKLQAAGRPLRYLGAVDEAALELAYAACTFTVYPSILEGFGLPVLESLQRGKPCICSGRGALGEAAGDGGCLTVDRPDRNALAGAIRTLLQSPDAIARLSARARSRSFRTWSDYTSQLLNWMRGLRPRTRTFPFRLPDQPR